MSKSKIEGKLRPKTVECLSLLIDFLEASKNKNKPKSIKDIQFYFRDFFEATYDVKKMDAGTYAHKEAALRYGLNRLVERGIISRQKSEIDGKRFIHESNFTLAELNKIRDRYFQPKNSQ